MSSKETHGLSTVPVLCDTVRCRGSPIAEKESTSADATDNSDVRVVIRLTDWTHGFHQRSSSEAVHSQTAGRSGKQVNTCVPKCLPPSGILHKRERGGPSAAVLPSFSPKSLPSTSIPDTQSTGHAFQCHRMERQRHRAIAVKSLPS